MERWRGGWDEMEMEMGLREGGGDENFRRPRGDKSSFQEEEDDDCFVKTIEFVCADFFIFVCERVDCKVLALSPTHTHTELVI